MTTLLEVMDACREKYGREIDDVEIPLVGRLIEAGHSRDDIVEYLADRVHIPTDDELETVRYEAVGDGVAEIPAALPEETG